MSKTSACLIHGLVGLLLGVPLLGLSACIKTNAVPSRIDASLLRGLPQASRVPIDAALATSSAARRAYSRARKETKLAAKSAELARNELSVVTHRVRIKRVTLAAVQRKEDAARLPKVEAEYAELLRIGSVARYGLALSRREHELAALQELLCLEELRLADARVELARATAIEGIDVVAKKAVPLEDIQGDALFHEREVKVADRRLADARSRMTQARADYEGALALMQQTERIPR